MRFLLRRRLDGTPMALLRQRLDGAYVTRQESLGPDGWVSNPSLDWTGIGGSADWEPITLEEAAEVALVLGHSPEVLTRR